MRVVRLALVYLQEWCWEVEVPPGGGGAGTREPQRGSGLALVLAAVRALLRTRHPRRAFNHYQMTRTSLLDHLLRACKVTLLPHTVFRNQYDLLALKKYFIKKYDIWCTLPYFRFKKTFLTLYDLNCNEQFYAVVSVIITRNEKL